MKIPVRLIVPDNFLYEKMIYDISTHYKLDPKEAASKWDIYDYYEFLVLKIHANETERYLIEQAQKDGNKY